MPARVIMQDFTGVPAVVDLAAMRDAMAKLGGDPSRVNPLVPADLVIDHSVQGRPLRHGRRIRLQRRARYERNGERYKLLRWAQTAFDDLRVVPPGTGIVTGQLEYLASVVTTRGRRRRSRRSRLPRHSRRYRLAHDDDQRPRRSWAYGVGGIEAEAVRSAAALPADPESDRRPALR